MRSKCKWIESGEKPSKYFCALEKRNYVSKNIVKLESQDRQITDQNEMLHEIKAFYQNLYASRDNELNDVNLEMLLNNYDIPKLKDEDKLKLEQSISLEEVGQAARSLKNDKSPGPDGFTARFFKFFWPNLKTIIFRSITEGLNKGELSTTQKMGIISIIPKGDKKRELLKNLRPISLLNVTYKIISYCITTRLKTVLSYIINENQKGFLKGRYIGENTRTLYDVMKILDNKKDKGLLLLVDFEKAFDSVSWVFIDKVLKFFNFGPTFRGFIKFLNNDFKLCVLQHGCFSSFFPVGRGCRQGDPISSNIFLLCVEILGILVRNNKDIKGIKLGKFEIKINQYADDTSLILDGSEHSLRHSLNLLDQYAKFSGLKPNIEKTRCIWLGNKKYSEDRLCRDIPLIWSKEPFKFLGIIFSINLKEMERLNFDSKISEIKNLINSWSRRLLTPVGKITVVKSIILSRLTHLFISLPNPSEKIISNLEQDLFRFVWSNKPHKIGRNIIMQNYEEGGLNMVNIRCFIKAMKMSWVDRLINDDSLLTELFELNVFERKENFFSVGAELLNYVSCNIKNEFWKDVINAFYELRDIIQNQSSETDFLYEEIWYNKKIKVDKKPVFYKAWADKKIMYIYDLYDQNGNLLNYDNFCAKFNFRPPITHFYGIVRSISKVWHNLRIRQNIILPNFKNYIRLIYKNKQSKKTLYQIFLSNVKNLKKINHISKWRNDLNFNIEDSDISKINLIPIVMTTDTKMRWFQYKIIHRSLATNVILNKMNIRQSDLCSFCLLEKETIFHLFCDCDFVKSFWEQFKNWICTNAEDISLNNFEIIFGKVKNKKYSCLNLLITLAKYHIYKQKFKNSRPLFFNFKLEIQYYYKLEKFIYKKNNREREFTIKWQLYSSIIEEDGI